MCAISWNYLSLAELTNQTQTNGCCVALWFFNSNTQPDNISFLKNSELQNLTDWWTCQCWVSIYWYCAFNLHHLGVSDTQIDSIQYLNFAKKLFNSIVFHENSIKKLSNSIFFTKIQFKKLFNSKNFKKIQFKKLFNSKIFKKKSIQ